MVQKTKPRWLGKKSKSRVNHSNSKRLKQWDSMSRKREQNFELSYTEKKNGHEGHVYVFRIADGLYKIGRTYNIAKRLKDLQAGNPHIKCVWSAWSPDCWELEKRIHVEMEGYHVDREFFNLSPDMMLEINNIAIIFNGKYK